MFQNIDTWGICHKHIMVLIKYFCYYVGYWQSLPPLSDVRRKAYMSGALTKHHSKGRLLALPAYEIYSRNFNLSGPGMQQGILKGSITVSLTSFRSGLESAVWQLTILVFICKRRIQASQTGGQWYSDASPYYSLPRDTVFNDTYRGAAVTQR